MTNTNAKLLGGGVTALEGRAMEELGESLRGDLLLADDPGYQVVMKHGPFGMR